MTGLRFLVEFLTEGERAWLSDATVPPAVGLLTGSGTRRPPRRISGARAAPSKVPGRASSWSTASRPTASGTSA